MFAEHLITCKNILLTTGNIQTEIFFDSNRFFHVCAIRSVDQIPVLILMAHGAHVFHSLWFNRIKIVFYKIQLVVSTMYIFVIKAII